MYVNVLFTVSHRQPVKMLRMWLNKTVKLPNIVENILHMQEVAAIW